MWVGVGLWVSALLALLLCIGMKRPQDEGGSSVVRWASFVFFGNQVVEEALRKVRRGTAVAQHQTRVGAEAGAGEYQSLPVLPSIDYMPLRVVMSGASEPLLGSLSERAALTASASSSSKKLHGSDGGGGARRVVRFSSMIVRAHAAPAPCQSLLLSGTSGGDDGGDVRVGARRVLQFGGGVSPYQSLLEAAEKARRERSGGLVCVCGCLGRSVRTGMMAEVRCVPAYVLWCCLRAGEMAEMRSMCACVSLLRHS